MENFSEYLIPEEWRDVFDLKEVEETEREFRMVLREKEYLIPKALRNKDVVLNGYKDPIEIIHFPLNGKLTYFKFYRRKWKEKGRRESFSDFFAFKKCNFIGCHKLLNFNN